MSKRKKYRRELEEIGKTKFDFIQNDEKKYYSYVSCWPMKDRVKKKLEDKYRFDSFKRWKNYVRDKYMPYEIDMLIEFSRYLNQCIRVAESGYAYWNLFLPVMITLILTELFETLIGMKIDVTNNSMWVSFIAYLLCQLIIISVYMKLIKHSLEPVRDNNIEKYLYIDYKEIIDEMIEEKSNI